jgi:hypothetical protein
MSKKRTSLEAFVAGEQPGPGEGGETISLPTPAAPASKAYEKATVYLPRAAAKRLKQMALDHDKRVNDLLQEGVDLMLAKYGQPSLKEFEGK